MSDTPLCTKHTSELPSTSPLERLRNIAKDARLLFESGQFADAKIMFERGESLINSATPSELPSVDKQCFSIEARTIIAIINIYHENDADGIDMNSITKEFDVTAITDQSAQTRLVIHLARWYAVLIAPQGKYDKAVQVLQDAIELIKTTNSSYTDAPEIQIRRDLAVIYGYAGKNNDANREISAASELIRGEMSRFKIATEKDTVEILKTMEDTSHTTDENHSRDVKQLLYRRETVNYASAVIDLIWGINYPTALQKTEKVYHGLRAILGPRHIMTLEAASRRGLLLAYNNRFHDAIVECGKARDLLIEILGDSHSKTLESQGYMVEIFNLQSRFLEGLETAESLYQKSRTSLTGNQPLHMQLRYELANSRLLNGDFHLAMSHLQEVVEASRKCYGRSHPDLLYYQSQLSQAYLKMGKLAKAKSLALEALTGQMEFYYIASLKGEIHRGSSLEIIFRGIKDFAKNQNKPQIHPRILSTLEIIASIEMETGPSNNGLVREILTSVVTQKIHIFGYRHISTLSSAYDLGMAFVSGTGEHISNRFAQFWFTYVYSQRAALLGADHAQTISAKRQLAAVDCLLNEWQNLDAQFVEQALGIFENSSLVSQVLLLPEYRMEDIDGLPRVLVGGDPITNENMPEVEATFRAILHSHESALGRHHPETVESFFSLLTVHLAARDTARIEETSRSLLHRIRHGDLRSQRLVESLKMETRVSMMYREHGYAEKAVEILRGITTYVRLIDDRDLCKAVNDMKDCHSKMLANWESDLKRG
ncbi:hypothetical protein F4809DRAFT_601118 [Biscogniauxia mediterranea]|nr:hypothetical protein F4809DRAFT_601118 [Biscogniauxia mediterranea]